MIRFVVALLMGAVPSVVLADFAPPRLTPAQKTTVAGMVIVGTIIDVEKDPVAALPYSRTGNKQDYTIATIKVQEGLVGAQGITQVRMGIAPLDLGPRRGLFNIEGLQAKKGYAGCFFLMQHPKADFMVCYPWAWPLPATAPTYEKDLSEVRTLAKLIEDPIAALKAKDKNDRAIAVQALLTRYNTVEYGIDPATVERVSVSAEESKLILNNLKELPWLVTTTGVARSSLWFLLRLTEKDGWIAPKSPAQGSIVAEYDQATLKWLEKHGNSFIIQKCAVKKK